MSCSGNLPRAFSPHFVFQFVTWGVYVFSVAQIFNLPYRRFVIGRASDRSHAPWFAGVWQNATLRYSRLQVCATGLGHTVNTYPARADRATDTREARLRGRSHFGAAKARATTL